MKLLYVDLFCGAGGTSTGVEKARHDGKKCAKVIACVNHDANAIASHAANHPDALHFTEDIRTLELTPLIEHVFKMRALYPDAFIVLWASLECTNFSRAKGGQPRDADSRTLAEHLFRYIEAINPDFIQIENVEEFMSWGDMDENGKPVSMDKGRLYRRWVSNVRRYGYDFDYRILNAADFGAYTSRKRFFGVFARKGLPIAFPEPTHSSKVQNTLFGSLEKWKSVKEVLDLSDKGESIFKRKRLLAEATLERIYAGLIKFVAGGKEAFTQRCKRPENNSISPTGSALSFLAAYYGNGNNIHSISKPSPTVTTKDRLALISTVFSDQQPGQSITDSAMTVKIKQFMKLYGIADIKMRMLKIPELKRIMGFPANYQLVGTQADQKKYIGNAVEVNMARVLCEALVEKLSSVLKQAV